MSQKIHIVALATLGSFPKRTFGHLPDKCIWRKEKAKKIQRLLETGSERVDRTPRDTVGVGALRGHGHAVNALPADAHVTVDPGSYSLGA